MPTILTMNSFQQYTAKHGLPTPAVTVHESLSDVLEIRGSGPRSESVHPEDGGLPEVIVGRGCGQAVLRGAEVYAPGVVGMPSYVAAGNMVEIYSSDLRFTDMSKKTDATEGCVIPRLAAGRVHAT